MVVRQDNINSISDAITGGIIPSDYIIRPIPNFIRHINDMELPLAKRIKTGESYEHLKLEFGVSEYAPEQDQLAEALDTTELTFTVDTPAAFQVYDRILIAGAAGRDPTPDEEQCLVADVGTADITVFARGYAGTTPATAADNSRIWILGPAVPENQPTPRSPYNFGTLSTNFPTEFGYSFQMSHRARVTPNNEFRGDHYEDRLEEKMKEAARDLDITLLLGKKNQGDGTQSNPSSMGGILQNTAVHTTDLNGAPLTLNAINSQLQTVAKDVGRDKMGKDVEGNYLTKRIFNTLIDERKQAMTTDEATRLTYSKFESDFGMFRFYTNQRMPDGILLIWNPDDCKLRPYKGGTWQDFPLAKDGWFDVGALVGDYHFEPKFERARAKITDFSILSADYANLV